MIDVPAGKSSKSSKQNVVAAGTYHKVPSAPVRAVEEQAIGIGLAPC